MLLVENSRDLGGHEHFGRYGLKTNGQFVRDLGKEREEGQDKDCGDYCRTIWCSSLSQAFLGGPTNLKGARTQLIGLQGPNTIHIIDPTTPLFGPLDP